MTGGIVGKHARSRRGSDAGLLQKQQPVLGDSHDSKQPPLPMVSSRRNCISGGFPGPKARPSVIFSTQKLGVTVGGCAAFYSAVLSCAPEHAVTVSLVNLPPCLRVSPSLVVFSSENWMVPQFFRVAVLAAVYDDNNKDDRKLQVLEHVSSSADARFSGNRIMFLPCNVLVQVSSREGCYLFASGAAGATVLEPPKPVMTYPTLREFAQVELGASRSQSTALGNSSSSRGSPSRDASLTVARSSVMSNQSFSSATTPSGVDAMNALAHAALAAKRTTPRRTLLTSSPSSASLAPSIQSSADAYYHSSPRDGVAIIKVVARAEHTVVLYKSGKSGLFGAMAVDYSTEERTTGDTIGANGSRGSNAALSRMLVDIDCGDAHIVALTEQGYVLTWGNGADGRLGHGSASSLRGPHAIRALFHKRVVQLACGAQHTVVVADDGDVYSWGYGKCGALGHGRSEREQSFDSVAMPMEVLALKHRSVARVACGDAHTAVVLANGALLTCGWSAYGRLGRTVPNEFTSVLERVTTGALASPTALVTFVACGAAHTLALTESKALVAFGWNAHGQLGLGDRRNRTAPTVLQYFDADDLVLTAVSAGKLHSMALTQDARVFAWGSDELGQCGIGAFPQIYTVPHLVPSSVGVNATQVSAGACHSVVLTTASHKQLDAMQTNHPTRYAALQDSYELFMRSDAAQRAKVLAFAKDAQTARELAARKRKPRMDPSLSLAKTLQLQRRLERDLEDAQLGAAPPSGQSTRTRPRTAGAVLLRSSEESSRVRNSSESESAAPAAAAALREQKVRCSSATLWRQTRLFTFQSLPPQQSAALSPPSSAIRAPSTARASTASATAATGTNNSRKSRPMSANPGASLQSVRLSTEARQSLARMLNGSDSQTLELQSKRRHNENEGGGARDKQEQSDSPPLHARFPASRPKSAPLHAARQQRVQVET